MTPTGFPWHKPTGAPRPPNQPNPPTKPKRPKPSKPTRKGRPTVRDIYAFAHRDRYGRIALAAIWVGLYLITSGTSHLWLELRRHPLT